MDARLEESLRKSHRKYGPERSGPKSEALLSRCPRISREEAAEVVRGQIRTVLLRQDEAVAEDEHPIKPDKSVSASFSGPTVTIPRDPVHNGLEEARPKIDARNIVPELKGRNPILRGVICTLARAVGLPLRILTNKQAHFNHHIFQAVESLFAGVLHYETGLRDHLIEQDKKIENLQADRAAQAEAIRSLENRLYGLQTAVKVQQNELNVSRAGRESLNARLDDLERKAEELAHLRKFTEEHARKVHSAMILFASVKQTIAAQENRLKSLLEEAHERLPKPFDQEQLVLPSTERDRLLDGLYCAFENVFRGSRAEIRERVAVHLDRVVCAGVGGQESPVLDIGCGRGEWLELLNSKGLVARGIDINRQFISICNENGVEAEEADAFAYLRTLSDESVGCVTSFHVVEHISFSKLVEFLDEIVRVLQPGGLVILETPNPQNVVVGATTFHSDPTHEHPIVPETLRFLVEERGLIDAEIDPLNAQLLNCPIRLFPETHELAEWLNPALKDIQDKFYSAPDYAVIARKAA